MGCPEEILVWTLRCREKRMIKPPEKKVNKFATSVIGSRRIPRLTILMLLSGAIIEVGYIALV